MIGDPLIRYQEDPVRMLRAIRFADKLDLTIHKDTAAPLTKIAHLLAQIPPSRLFDELLKLLLTGHALKSFQQLQKYSLFKPLFPMTAQCLTEAQDEVFTKFIRLALESTDQRINDGKTVTPAFLFAVLLWEPVQKQALELRKQDFSPLEAMEQAAQNVVSEQNKYVCIPRRFTHSMRSIWSMQPLFFRRHGERAARLMEQPRFRAAYDFLLLRAQAGEKVDQVANWWEKFTTGDAEQRAKLIASLPKRAIKAKRK